MEIKPSKIVLEDYSDDYEGYESFSLSVDGVDVELTKNQYNFFKDKYASPETKWWVFSEWHEPELKVLIGRYSDNNRARTKEEAWEKHRALKKAALQRQIKTTEKSLHGWRKALKNLEENA